MIRTVCAYCRSIIHAGPLSPEGLESTGCCRPCFEAQLAEFEGISHSTPELAHAS